MKPALAGRQWIKVKNLEAPAAIRIIDESFIGVPGPRPASCPPIGLSLLLFCANVFCDVAGRTLKRALDRMRWNGPEMNKPHGLTTPKTAWLVGVQR
jgi:hypothetical protein